MERKEIFSGRVALYCRIKGHGGSDFFLMNAVTEAPAHNGVSSLLH